MSEWQPISSAPKDGTRFWGRVDDDAIVMLWHETFQAFVSSWLRMRMARGYTVDGNPFKDHSPVIHNPEFWMPLPHPPDPAEYLREKDRAGTDAANTVPARDAAGETGEAA